jgi:hypothetical protein
MSTSAMAELGLVSPEDVDVDVDADESAWKATDSFLNLLADFPVKLRWSYTALP